jgi:hypothetical protein
MNQFRDVLEGPLPYSTNELFAQKQSNKSQKTLSN